MKHLHCLGLSLHVILHFMFSSTFITKLDKVIILQYIIDSVIRVQQTRTLAPAHNETSILYWRDAAVVWFVLDVTFKSFQPEPPDGAGSVSAWHCQPLVSDVDCKTRHRASAGLQLQWGLFTSVHRSTSAAESSSSNQMHRHRTPASLMSHLHRPPRVSPFGLYWPKFVHVT